jgi:DNA-binding Xre family transcriptional regulator
LAISYNKLWKLLIDKKTSKADLCKAAGLAPDIMAWLQLYEEVLPAMFSKICTILDMSIGGIVEFTSDERDGRYDG